MSKRVGFDDDELRQLEIDLRKAPLRTQFNARKAMKKAARIVQREMKIDAAGHHGNYFGAPGTEFLIDLPRHVSYDILDAYTAEIGFENKGSGSLAHILVYGSVNNDPVFDHTAGLRRSEQEITYAFAEAAERSVLGGEGRE